MTARSASVASAAPDGTITVLVASAHRLVREALSESLRSFASVEVVAFARDARSATAQARRHRPTVLVLSDDMGWRECLEATRVVAPEVRGCSVLLLVGEGDPDAAADAIEAGARGYVTRRVGMQGLYDDIVRIAGDGAAIPDELVRPLLDRLVLRRSGRAQDDRILSSLSAREREVLLLLADGGSSDSIATALVISRETARKHVQNILVKMGVRSRLEAVAYVVQADRRARLTAAR